MVGKPDHIDHRKLLHPHFMKNCVDILPSYELLSLVMFPSLPRRDTEPLAKALLKRFGSSAKIISADHRK
jgi:DNA repair protein RadC